MITTGAKYFFGIATIGFVAALVYAWGADGGLLGAASLGFRGGVGEHTGFIVLVTFGTVAAVTGGFVVAFRDADAEAVTQYSRARGALPADAPDQVPVVRAARGASWWPAIGAVAAGCVAVGLVSSNVLFVFGLVLGGVVVLEWMASAWADRATGDPVENRRIRNRVLLPIEVPVFGAIGVAVVVLCLSRVFLAVDKNAAAILAIVFSSLVLAMAFVIAASPKAGKSIAAVFGVLGALGVIAGGIISAAEGTRTIEVHHEEEREFLPPDRDQPPPTIPAESGDHAVPTPDEE